MNRNTVLEKEEQILLKDYQRIANEFYVIKEGRELNEITLTLILNHHTPEEIKKHIIESGRRFFIFKYPSDGFYVKGLISFISNSTNNPLMVYFRGGNRILGLTDPASDLFSMKNYTVISTAYRGGVSEGMDEYGGNEVNDVDHLIKFMPTLEQKMGISLNYSCMYMLGASRGGMEMFLALSRFPWLQNQVKKAVSLSGLLDMDICLNDRSGVKEMCIQDFGLIPSINEQEWIARRNPINAVSKIRNDLPFLIMQGKKDLRISLDQGVNMAAKLKANGNAVTYLELPDGNHCLRNCKDRANLISNWLEQP